MEGQSSPERPKTTAAGGGGATWQSSRASVSSKGSRGSKAGSSRASSAEPVLLVWQTATCSSSVSRRSQSYLNRKSREWDAATRRNFLDQSPLSRMTNPPRNKWGRELRPYQVPRPDATNPSIGPAHKVAWSVEQKEVDGQMVQSKQLKRSPRMALPSASFTFGKDKRVTALPRKDAPHTPSPLTYDCTTIRTLRTGLELTPGGSFTQGGRSVPVHVQPGLTEKATQGTPESCDLIGSSQDELMGSRAASPAISFTRVRRFQGGLKSGPGPTDCNVRLSLGDDADHVYSTKLSTRPAHKFPLNKRPFQGPWPPRDQPSCDAFIPTTGQKQHLAKNVSAPHIPFPKAKREVGSRIEKGPGPGEYHA